ncbi:nucleoprotein TPR-like [Pyrus ussuriensis x Pyrus communis]|uniref:Nucleoprotein TPR-like n=1 Tax=Pyrus ussuriensis x Pyrus communis TaxID=2448454 RepID=A0A5N5GZI2_9ROSA|nr:nucleoprotein TPR-like [Pyrus ussuriensis x Pyrus communis]
MKALLFIGKALTFLLIKENCHEVMILMHLQEHGRKFICSNRNCTKIFYLNNVSGRVIHNHLRLRYHLLTFLGATFPPTRRPITTRHMSVLEANHSTTRVDIRGQSQHDTCQCQNKYKKNKKKKKNPEFLSLQYLMLLALEEIVHTDMQAVHHGFNHSPQSTPFTHDRRQHTVQNEGCVKTLDPRDKGTNPYTHSDADTKKNRDDAIEEQTSIRNHRNNRINRDGLADPAAAKSRRCRGDWRGLTVGSKNGVDRNRMDKNKSRTDLLAAGRKKLQQFRQKKDGKGSGSGKSTKTSDKSEKHEADADVVSSATKPTAVPQTPEGETESHVDANLENINSSGSHSAEISTASDINAAAPSAVPITHERNAVETLIYQNAESASQEVGFSKHDVNFSTMNVGENTGGTDAEVARVSSLDSSHVMDSRVLAKDANMSISVDVLAQPTSVDDTDQTKGRDEESLPPSQNINTSLVQEREDQVTDVGAMQEADGLDAKNCNRSQEADMELKGDDRISSSELDKTFESFSGQAPSLDKQTDTLYEASDREVELAGDKSVALSEIDRTAETFPDLESSIDDQTGKADEASLSTGATMSGGLSVSDLALPEADRSLVVSAAMENRQETEDVPGGEEHGALLEDHHQKKGLQRPPEANMVIPDKEWTASPVADVSSISLSQLTEVVRRLSEEEFRVLMKSIESVSNAFQGTTNLIVPEHVFPEMFERLKEELVLTHLTKNISDLQLVQQSEMQVEFDCQHDQLLDETSLLRASLQEVREKNQCLAEELSECRCELQAVVSGKEEFQGRLQTAKAEVEEFSARAIESHSSLERSQQDLLSLSAELADCKSLVAALQVENEKLNGSIALWDEDRKKLVEQNDLYLHEKEKLSAELVDGKSFVEALQDQISSLSGSLSSVTEERKKYEEEKEHLSSENDKLAIEVADSKNTVLALQVENGNLNGILSMVTEESKKLEEEKNHLFYENEKLAIELAASKNLVLDLQVKNEKLNGNLVLVTEERNKLKEEKDYSAHEIERLSSEILLVQERLSAEHEEHMRFVVDQKETTTRLEQLSEENIFLTSSLDTLKAKMKEVDTSGIKIASQAGEGGDQVELSEVRSRRHEIENEKYHQVPGMEDSEGSFIMVEKPSSDGGGGSPVLNLGREVFDDSVGFVALKGRVEEAEKMMNKLVQEIEGICSRSELLNRSGDKVSTPPVSKLIQAFESKVHLDEHDVEERGLTDNQSPADSIASVREQTGNLRALFEQLLLDAANASELLKEERDGRKTANATFGEMKDQYEDLEEHSKKLEATNIELCVLYEALEQHRGSIETRNSELLVLCESLRLHVTNLEAENLEVGRKLHRYESRINQLQSRLHDLHLSSNDMVSQISDQLENFHKEAAERILILEQRWNSTLVPVVEAIGKLGESIGGFSTTTPMSHECLDTSHFVASVYDAITVIEDLKEKLKSSQTDHEAICILHKEVNEKCDDLHVKNELASDMLHKLYGNLSKLLRVLHGSIDESEMNLKNEKLPHPLDYSIYETIIEQLENFLSEGLQLQSVNKKLNSELMVRTEEFEELKQRCLDSSAIQKLIEDIEGVLEVENAEFQADKMLASRLESLVSCLVQKYKDADAQVGLSKEGFQSKVMESTSMQEEIQQLNASCFQLESETIVLRESLRQVEEALLVTRSELQEKLYELEQSEQRVSSLREKLSIAVSKGKGLIVQRDGLKQSLAEKSSELERFLQELQFKDSRLLEVETKLKAYSEAGERVEALESELSYIRNSATALRESFLLKDSVLQRIEEILEDLDLPEHFHSRDIIEKIDWLARSATGNTFPQTDSDQKSSAGGGSSDAGFVVMDSWKDDVQPSSDSSDDFKRKYDELQSKFYGLAEQNEMLEQSLMERNNLVQRWEELLDRIDMPSHLRSLEPEDRIEWLRKELSEVQGDNMSLQQKVVNLESHCVTLTADLEDSRRRTSDLEEDLQTFIDERNNLSQRLELLINDHDKLSAKAAGFELENEKLQEEVSDLQENVAKLCGIEKQILSLEDDIRRLQGLVTDALQDPGTNSEYSGESSIECFEGLLNKLLENYATLSSEKPAFGVAADGIHTENSEAMVVEARSTSTPDIAESDIVALKKELEEVQREIFDVKEERDGYVEKQRSLACELEVLDKKVNELQGLLNQEEQKSASVREKLSVAVRKGKQLVQQRDSLKQNIDEINSEVERLRSEIKIGEGKLAEYEQKFRDLSAYPGRVEALQSESLFLRNCLKETENNLQEKGNTLSLIINILGNIDVAEDANSGDPVLKLEQIGKMCCDMRANMASSEQEARKSKRAAELLLAELNEVQERNDGLQEELAKSASELAILSKERDLAEAAKLEALAHLEMVSTAHSEERKHQFSEFSGLKSGVDQLRKGFHDVSSLLAAVFHQDLVFLQNLESGIGSCLKSSSAADVVDVPLFTTSDGFITSKSDKENFILTNSWSDSNMHGQYDDDDNFIIEIFTYVRHYLQELEIEIGLLKEKLDEHSISLHEKASSISKSMAIVRGELTSKNESFEALKRDLLHMEMVEKEKDNELLLLRRNIALLFEACTKSVMEMGRRKAELVGNGWSAGEQGMILKLAELSEDGLSFSGEDQFRSEEHVRSMTDTLLSTVSDFGSLTTEIVEGGQKELKITISKLQKELQEKDIQKERICMELVSQIKQAEAAATSYSTELQSSKSLVHDLEKRVEVMKGERNLLEQRVNELEDGCATSTDLQERVRSLTDVIAAKDQEIEDLMQALDDEEVQMQGHTSRIKELEKVVEQKNLDLENLDTSRGKVMKKLSITVSKFDELHHLSASLLAEVEKLQSQLQERDDEISFLRQEITRCTNDVLVASQTSNKRNSEEIHELLTWFDMNIAWFGMHNGDQNNDQVSDHKEILKKKIDFVIQELGDLRAVAESKDTLLQVERSKVEELTRKGETLEKYLHEKESRLNLLDSVGDSGRGTSSTSEIVEVEPAKNNWAVAGTSVAPQVRSLRKGNNDQVAIAIDMDSGSSGRLEDEEDDKVHGFKSLTTSRIVPRFTRPVSDMVDGLWMSCDRALMRKPVLRLGIILYWAVLHALLATFAI